MSHDQSITPEDLRQWVCYDPETGKLFWKLTHGRKIEVATTMGGYIRLRLAERTLAGHRVAWALHYGRWPALLLDHINGDTKDNRVVNLREVTHVENCRNAKKASNNTSGVTGVYWRAKDERWVASIGSTKTKTRRRREFRTFEEAVACRRAFEAEEGYSPLHGEDEAVRWLLG
jgi:hypothetical protein